MRELAKRYWQAVWNDRDLNAVDELIADPYIRHSGTGDKVLRREELKREYTQSWELLHGASTIVEDQAISGDRIWTRATMRGINLQTGEPSILSWLIVHRIQDGRFAESWSATVPGVQWN